MNLGPGGVGNQVLIVVDNEEHRHALRVLCESEGLEVVGEATNGIEAVPLTLRLQPDVVILDLMRPQPEGQRSATVLRAVSPGTRIMTFSTELDEAPAWADAYLNRERISQLMPLLDALIR